MGPFSLLGSAAPEAFLPVCIALEISEKANKNTTLVDELLKM